MHIRRNEIKILKKKYISLYWRTYCSQNLYDKKVYFLNTVMGGIVHTFYKKAHKLRFTREDYLGEMLGESHV
jgi:hypothetical protein